jgi:RNA polymerase sigma-70 factor, ECF subfamily
VTKPHGEPERVTGDVETPMDRIVPVSGVFEDVFREHYEAMVRSLALACGDREVAADCVQDAFVRAYVRWRRIARYDDPVGWIRRVALNRIRDHFRKTLRGGQAVARLAGEPARVDPGPGESPPPIEELLDRLPPQQRTAAALFYVEQLSVREVATSMELSEGAVKYHLHAARTALRPIVEARADG